MNRLERDRHFLCSPTKCVAPPPKRLKSGRSVGKCIPRAAWYLRTQDSAGRRVSISFRSESEAREAMDKLAAAKKLGLNYNPRAAAAPAVPLFKDVAEAALTLYASITALSLTTIENHSYYINKHLLSTFRATPATPQAITRSAIRSS